MNNRKLEIRQRKMLNALYDTDSPQFDFWTIEDTQNQKEQKLVTAKVVTNCSELKDVYRSIDNFICINIHINNNRIGIDIESEGLNYVTDKPIGVGLAIPNRNYGVTEDKNKWFDCYFILCHEQKSPDYEQLIEGISQLIKKYNDRVVWALHNAKFDQKYIYHYFGCLLKNIEDSMVMSYLLGDRHSAIDYLAPKYLSRFPWTLKRYLGKSNLSKEDFLNIDVQWLGDYCAEDCVEGVLLCEVLEDRLEEEGLYELYYNVDRYCVNALVWNELNGMLVDWEKLREVKESAESEQDAIIETLAMHIDKYKKETLEIVRSPQKLSHFLYEEKGFPTEGIKQGKKFFSTDETSLQKIRYHDKNIVGAILDYRELSKVVSTYVDGMKIRERNGRVHSDYQNAFTDTGRLSSRDPNLQNIPNAAKSPTGKIIRQSFIAPEGKILVKCDWSQFELRILAHFSRDPYLIDAYRKGLDIHSVVTCLLFDIPYEAFDPNNNKEHKKKRTIVKNINFGLIYGMTALKLMRMAIQAGLDYTYEQCEDIMNRYWARLPGVRDWMAANRLKAISNGYTETILGRRRYFEFEHPYLKALRGKPIDLTYSNWEVLVAKGVTNNPKDQASFRQIGNAPIQGSNGDALRIALGQCFDTWYGTDTLLIGNVHDEIILETPIEGSVQVKEQLEDIMTRAVELEVPVVAEASMGYSWGDC